MHDVRALLQAIDSGKPDPQRPTRSEPLPRRTKIIPTAFETSLLHCSLHMNVPALFYLLYPSSQLFSVRLDSRLSKYLSLCKMTWSYLLLVMFFTFGPKHTDPSRITSK
jgi:hypothetical protein